MSANLPSPRIGIFGSDNPTRDERHGCGLWAAGHQACVTAAGGAPTLLGSHLQGRTWEDVLAGIDGVILATLENPTSRQLSDAEALCRWCEDHEIPLLAIDTGMEILNAAYNGTAYNNLPRELPEALQHRHPPERGLRHAIDITPETRLSVLYGDGEVVVNSEHRQAIQKVARGFRVSAKALDGVIEAIEADHHRWFCVGVQWQPASATASGLDIQLFRGLIEACQKPAAETEPSKGVFCSLKRH